MAYSQGFFRVTWIFGIVDTDEVALTHLDFTNAGQAGTINPATNAIAEGFYDAMATMLGAGPWNVGSYGILQGVKIAAVKADGHYGAEPFNYARTSSFYVGGTEGVPPQSSVVISLRAAGTLGKGNRGRMYIPFSRGNYQTGTPYISAGNLASLANAAEAFLNACNLQAQTLASGALASIMSETTPPSAKPVASIRVGNVVDTQRRRRDQLTETYESRLLD